MVTKNVFRVFALLGALLAIASASLSGTTPQSSPPLHPAASDEITFPQTGMTLSDAHGFLAFWQGHGGLAQFGYPLTPETIEVSPTDGRPYITQWFERNRFEYHPENSDPQYRVLLGLLGRDLSAGREKEARFLPASDPHNANCVYFAQTSHTLCNTFREYWNAHGGLALYGYPLSEELQEKNQTDGKQYTVQYFERNRLEYHPENKGTPYEVLLGLLGVQIGGFPVPAMPQVNITTTLQIPGKTTDDAKWSEPHTLTGPAGMKVSLFGTGPTLRMMAVSPGGDLFVSSTRDGKVFVMPDRNSDGTADETRIFAQGLSKPHGLAFHNNYLYVACEGAVFRFPYVSGQLQASGDGKGQQIADLPSGASQGLVKDVNHDTRSIVFGRDNKMYISIGSDCDVCEEGDPRRATIMQFNDDGSGGRIYASGLRNAVGLDIDPRTGLLWASVNERNTRGSDIPPDMLTPIHGNADYGWPYCMGIPLQPDPQFNKPISFCAPKESGAVALPAHIAPLGISFYNGGGQLSHAYDYGIFLAMHGTAPATPPDQPLHNPPYGYDVQFVSLRPGKTAQGPQVVISGWLSGTKYWGRPVDVVFGKDGAMYISDDAAGAVYRVTFATK